MSSIPDDFCSAPTQLTAIHRAVEDARAGTNPRVIARLNSGWAVLGEKQIMRGYCLLLPDPVVPHLNSLSSDLQIQFLKDMSILGAAVLTATNAIRINYEILGNLEPALHAHVIPRFGDDEPPELSKKPIWFFDWENAPAFDFERDERVMRAIRDRIKV